MYSLIEEVSFIYEDENFIALNKPSGLVVNTSKTSPVDTLQEYLVSKFNLESPIDNENEFISRSGIVHRLDKDTSGVMLVAKNEVTFNFFQHEFKKRRVQKEYLALTLNKLPQERIIVDAPLLRDKKNRMRYAVSAEGRVAKTEFKLVQDYSIDSQNITLVECYPQTGRTHQIRVHLAALGTPILGDVIYSGRRQLLWSDKHGFNRLMLHAKRIGIRLTHESQELTFFEAPTPEDFTL